MAGGCTPNIEVVTLEDLDLELLNRRRHVGSVLNWRDNGTDLYDLRSLERPVPES